MLLIESRRRARSTSDGELVLLLEPGPPARWDAALIAEGQGLVRAMPAAGPARPVPDPGGDPGRARRRGDGAGHRLAADRAAVRPAPRRSRRARGRPEPGRRGGRGRGPGDGAGPGGSYCTRGLLPLPRHPRRPAAPARPRRRGGAGVPGGHRPHRERGAAGLPGGPGGHCPRPDRLAATDGGRPAGERPVRAPRCRRRRNAAGARPCAAVGPRCAGCPTGSA